MTAGRSIAQWAGTAGCAALLALPLLALLGCGTPGAPLPPSLRLPTPVSALAATRAGNLVTLQWTNPTRTTDKQLITSFQHEMEADLCRAEQLPTTAVASADCTPLLTRMVKPGSQTTVTDTLPQPLASGTPRPLLYWLLLRNRKGKTAGPSNVALVVAGSAPNAVSGLTATASADGVVLRWQPDGSNVPVRLHRHVLRSASVPSSKPAPISTSGAANARAGNSMAGLPPEPVDEDLMVDLPARSGSAGAVDREARFDEEYSYTAQRVVALPGISAASNSSKDVAHPSRKIPRKPARKPTGNASANPSGTTASVPELASFVSAPVTVTTTDTFAPAVPHGLAAIYTQATHTVDLSWMPDTEPDLAGYFVDRSQDGGPWKQISPADPVTVPAYSDTAAEPGHSDRYAVSSVDTHGNRSARSAPVAASTTP